MGLRIALIDDHKMLIDLLAKDIVNSKNIDKVDKYYNGYDFLAAYKAKNYDLAVIDLQMPEINGLDLVGKIREEDSSIKIMILSGVESDGVQPILEKKGIDGLVTKYNHIDVIINAIVTIGSGEKCFVNDFREHDSQLSSREIDIVRLMAKENTNKEIAENLFISENTVKTHRKNIMKKLDAKNIASVIGYVYKNHLV
ncbi:MAG: response regulator transcription factor [Flavobacteriales bacterium]|nr:response regulator transcription factor [Flavobacteriales bacterium]